MDQSEIDAMNGELHTEYGAYRFRNRKITHGEYGDDFVELGKRKKDNSFMFTLAIITGGILLLGGLIYLDYKNRK